MTTFHFSGDTLLASRIDIARAARALRKHLAGVADELGIPETARSPLRMDQGQGVDLLCKILGGQSHYAARRAAEDTDISSWPTEARQKLIDDLSVSHGRKFPSRLPPEFGKAWQAMAIGLAGQAMAGLQPTSGELIALIGGAGSGKTLLANAMADRWGGTVIDVSLTSPTMVPEHRKRGKLMVYDAPAAASQTTDSDASRAQGGMPRQTARTASTLIAERRQSSPPARFVQSEMHRLVDTVIQESLGLVMSFPDTAAVERFMEAFYAYGVGGRQVPNWTMAHVIDLDEMRCYVLPAPAPSFPQADQASA